MEALTPTTGVLIPHHEITSGQNSGGWGVKDCISSEWSGKVREEVGLPGISNRFISRDGKNVIREGGEDFESTVCIINFQRGLHAI